MLKKKISLVWNFYSQCKAWIFFCFKMNIINDYIITDYIINDHIVCIT